MAYTTKPMAESYQTHLTALHAKVAIPEEVLTALLWELSPVRVLAKERIIGGEVNEVYAVTFADRTQVIVRIERGKAKGFAQEQWAIQECAKRGVPVPEVLGIWQIATEKQPLHVCIQRKIAGVPLAHAQLPASECEPIVVQAGEFLSRIHEIPVKGFGYLNGSGEGTFATAADEHATFQQMAVEFYDLARRVAISQALMHCALQLIDEAALRLPQTAGACLTHNDFSAKHLLVDKGRLTGIIDFGEVAGSEPLADLVHWDYYDAACFPLAWLQAGYANKQVLNAAFAQRLHSKRLEFSLWAMRWYDQQSYAPGVADARSKFLADLDRLEP